MRTYLSGVLLVGALVSSGLASPIVYSGTGITGTTDARDALRVGLGGGTVAGANGSFGGVRREINWDGVPDALSSPSALPNDFFNTTSPRGVVFSTPGTGFQVSANSSVGNVRFDNINPGYSTLFTTFSAQRLFSPIGSTITDVTFFIPGTSTPGATRGFGSVFTDADRAIISSIEFFDTANVSLGKFFVPDLLGDSTLEFLGVDFGLPIVSRVRITSGNLALAAGASETPTNDLVVMDDFIYGEPAAVPEPATLGLLAIGAAALLTRRKRTR